MEFNIENSFKVFEYFWLYVIFFCGKFLMIFNFFYRINLVKWLYWIFNGWRDFGGGRYYKEILGKE